MDLYSACAHFEPKVSKVCSANSYKCHKYTGVFPTAQVHRRPLGQSSGKKWRAARLFLRGSSLESSATGNGGASGVLFAGAAWKVRQQGMEGRQAFSSSGNRAAPEIPAIGAQTSYAQGRSGGRRKTRSGNARRANYRAQPGDLRLQVSAG